MGILGSIASKVKSTLGVESSPQQQAPPQSSNTQQAPPSVTKTSSYASWSKNGRQGYANTSGYGSKYNGSPSSTHSSNTSTSRPPYAATSGYGNQRPQGSQGPTGKSHNKYQSQKIHRQGWSPSPPTQPAPSAVHQQTLGQKVGQKVGTWAKEEKQYWKGEATGVKNAAVSAIKHSPGTIKRGVDVGLANMFTFGSPKLRYKGEKGEYRSKIREEMYKKSVAMGVKYEQGRRDMVTQLRVKTPNRMVNEVIGNPVPAPMWTRGSGGGRRSYTSTYKSRRQARSSAHRAKLQRRGGGFQF